MAPLLAAADIGILSSNCNEGFSNGILESMAAGLPMVVTAVGGNAEAVLDGQTGFVVPPHDPTTLGNAILTLADDPCLRKKMGTRARARATEHFSLAASAATYRELYENLLGRH